MSSRSQVRGILACLASGLVAGCTQNAPHNAASVERVDSAGTEIVTSPSKPEGEPAAWTVGTTPRVSIGQDPDADPAYQFAQVGSTLTLSDGRIVVVDGASSEVRWFSPSGEHLHTSGGRGQGPGEFTYAARAYRRTGDTLAVENRPRIKHVLFSPEGDLVREEVQDFESLLAFGPFMECGSRSLPDQSLVTCVQEAGRPAPVPDPGPGLLRNVHRFVRIPWDMSGVDTLGLNGGIEQFGIAAGERTSFAVHPFHSRTWMAVAENPLRIGIARNPHYSIEIWTPEGHLERIIRRAGARRAPSETELRAAQNVLPLYATGDEALAARFVAEVPSPDSIPAVQGLVFSRSGELFVARTPWLRDATTVGEWDIFDPTGRWSGTLQLPPRFRITEVGTDYLLGIATDELDVQSIEVWDLHRPAGSP